MHVPDSHRVVPSQIISGHERRKTLMIMNIPIRLQMHDLEHLVKHSIDESNFDGIRLPQDDQRPGFNKGYAFVNCTSSEAVLHFWIKWHSKGWHEMYPNFQKKCQLAFAQHQLPARKSIQGVTVQACHSEAQKSAGFPVRVQKSAAPSHEHPQSAVQSDQPTSKLSSACAIDVRAPDLQYDQHHDEEDYDERTENVHTVRARSTDGAQKESRRERRIRRLQDHQQAEAACGDLTESVDSSTTKCVSVDGKGRARTIMAGEDVSGGDRGDDGGGDGGDDGGGEGGEDDGGQGSSDGDGAVHRWLRQTETAEAAPAAGLPAGENLDGVAASTAKLPSNVAGRQHPIPSDRIAEEQQAIDSQVRMRQSLQDSIHAMQASTLAINRAAELAARDPARINTAVVAAILAEEQQASDSTVRMGQFLKDSIHAMRASTLAIIQAAELAASDPTRNNDIP
jgi:uncharacterized membrane protein YgcG